MKRHITTILLVLMMLAGVGLLAYPTASNMWNQMHQSYAIAGYERSAAQQSVDNRKEILASADAYNEELTKHGNLSQLDDEELALYKKELDITGTGIMGYIHIPKMNIRLPIYHTTDDAVLQIAVGHLPGTSLPVGGKSTHSVLSGHRGLSSARLFTDLDQLVIGDTFTITVLDRQIVYKVDQILVVLPEEEEALRIVKGEDYCTLVTCTPYGINSHRLLVRGKREKTLLTSLIENDSPLPIPLPISEGDKKPLAALAVVIFVLILLFRKPLLRVFTRHKKDEDKEKDEDH